MEQRGAGHFPRPFCPRSFVSLNNNTKQKDTNSCFWSPSKPCNFICYRPCAFTQIFPLWRYKYSVRTISVKASYFHLIRTIMKHAYAFNDCNKISLLWFQWKTVNLWFTDYFQFHNGKELTCQALVISCQFSNKPNIVILGIRIVRFFFA